MMDDSYEIVLNNVNTFRITLISGALVYINSVNAELPS